MKFNEIDTKKPDVGFKEAHRSSFCCLLTRSKPDQHKVKLEHILREGRGRLTHLLDHNYFGITILHEGNTPTITLIKLAYVKEELVLGGLTTCGMDPVMVFK